MRALQPISVRSAHVVLLSGERGMLCFTCEAKLAICGAEVFPTRAVRNVPLQDGQYVIDDTEHHILSSCLLSCQIAYVPPLQALSPSPCTEAVLSPGGRYSVKNVSDASESELGAAQRFLAEQELHGHPHAPSLQVSFLGGQTPPFRCLLPRRVLTRSMLAGTRWKQPRGTGWSAATTPPASSSHGPRPRLPARPLLPAHQTLCRLLTQGCTGTDGGA
eukprot:2751842-Rhodomonas_salina.1